ncbi:MAG: hypothetical protein GQ534_10785 [Candidatus Delongbacteria bacterium]|nr:hypothetical protein [Candidatus Delongbacteria bacterium]
MYKFNFLQKINLEKKETSKKNRFITTVFMMSVTVQLILLGLLFLKSLSVNSSFQEAVDEKNKYEKQTNDFRNKGFFGYKNINHVYNVQTSRRQLSYLFKSFEASLDTTMIIEKFGFEASDIRLDIISRTRVRKSKLMSEINQLKSRISDLLLEENYILKASDVGLIKGPDLKSKETNSDGTQYWSFAYSVKLNKIAVKKAKKKNTKKSHNVNI